MIYPDIEAMCSRLKNADPARDLDGAFEMLDDARALLRRCQELLAPGLEPESVMIEPKFILAKWRKGLDGVGPTELVGWLFGERE